MGGYFSVTGYCGRHTLRLHRALCLRGRVQAMRQIMAAKMEQLQLLLPPRHYSHRRGDQQALLTDRGSCAHPPPLVV
jgi:hypothetical protein